MKTIDYSVDVPEWTRYFRSIEMPDDATPDEIRAAIWKAEKDGAYSESSTKVLGRVEPLDDEINWPQGLELLMHARTSATTYGSVTGRMTSGSAALLDLPRDSPVKSSSPVVNVDYADLELRVLAGLSPEEQRRAYGGTD